MNIQENEIIKQLNIDYDNIKDDPIKLHAYNSKKEMLLSTLTKYSNDVEEKKLQLSQIINMIKHKDNTKAMHFQQEHEKIEKMNNLKEVCQINISKLISNQKARLYDVVTEYVDFHIFPPDKWLFQYELTPIKFDFKSRKYNYRIKLSSIPNEHFLTNRNKQMCFNLYIVDRIPKVMTVLFDGNTKNAIGTVICGKSLLI
jgi:hypothetical protein